MPTSFQDKENGFNIWEKILEGVSDGRKAYCGPHTAQIDLTDRCNNDCIACWIHSPLVDKKKFLPKGPKELPFTLTKSLIEDLHKSGTKEIILSGSGEPLVYPRIKEVIELIKSSGMYLNIITNGTLIDEKMARFLVDKKVDLITASIWAGTAQAYVDTHPSRSVEDFEALRGNFKRLAAYKRQSGRYFPSVKVYNVLCSKNYDDIEEMFNFAKDLDAEFIEFQIVDIVEGMTDELALTEQMREKIFRHFENIAKRSDYAKWRYGSAYAPGADEDAKDFGKIWKNKRADFRLLEMGENLICRKGKHSHRGEHSEIIFPPGQRQCLGFKFYFTKEDCELCEHVNSCFVCDEKDSVLGQAADGVKVWNFNFSEQNSQENDTQQGSLSPAGISSERYIEVKLLNILGIEDFIRRISSPKVESGIYEQQLNETPCYIGWYYVRILANGDVIPCCKASFHPLGNLYKRSFPKIWQSRSYNKFRFKAKELPKTDAYFSRINCLKSCDNWGMNLGIHQRFIACQDNLAAPVTKDITPAVTIVAKDFLEGNLNPGIHDFGGGLLIHGGQKPGFARYRFRVEEDGHYEFWSRYTSAYYRPVDIYIDDKLEKKECLGGFPGGWTPEFLRWYKEFTLDFTAGEHTLEIRSQEPIPHIEKFVLFKKGAKPDFIDKKEVGSYLNVFNQYLAKRGLKESLTKVAYHLTPKNLKDRYLEILGIYDREYGYKGPFHIQIDLTNMCNNNCIACWCNSPLIDPPRLSEDEKNEFLPLEMVKELLDETHKMGATEVYYSGSGEPFMHPQIMEVLEYTKSKNLICHVNTNFTLLTRQKVDCLIKLGVDFLTVSTWAATPKTYIDTHPNKSVGDFYRIRENLIYLNSNKKEKPLIKLYNVIFNMNYFEVEAMVDFAHETKSESVEFTLVDTMPGSTEVLALTKEQLGELKQACARIKSNLDNNNKVKSKGVLLFLFDQFLRRISVSDDVEQAKYDRNVIDSMPCYIGWLFARVIPNGQMHSCLKAHRIPTGSLYTQRFSEIWNSRKQMYFRKKTLVYKKSDNFFRMIGNDSNTQEAGCYKSCDDIARNSWIHNRITMLSMPEHIMLKALAKILKLIRKFQNKKEDYKDYHKNPVFAGILHGRKAFEGPEQVVVDATNRCNLRCLACWLYSPLLKKDKPDQEVLKQELSKQVLLRLVDDLASMGTRIIRFTGGGEPFMHKDLMSIIAQARRKGLDVAITTNFALLERKQIKELVDLGIEELAVSIWASEARVYTEVHPNTSWRYFERLKENLLYLKSLKKKKPRLTFANVLMNSNLGDFEKMYDFGIRYGADAIYFTLVDVLSGQTDVLLLSEKQRIYLYRQALRLKEMAKAEGVELEFFEGLLRRLSDSKSGYSKGEYDREYIDKIPCYVGWIFARVLANGQVAPCCRGVKKDMGNINNKSFKEIWFSRGYDEFRARAKFLSKSDIYFKDIGCVKECDNLMHNEEIHRRIKDAL
ncbi:MAG: radical SAM protein [Candidatus Omnitrophica bacterium]|nr:radical SAM protein [Candidatus Omnitrophota bacterium]